MSQPKWHRSMEHGIDGRRGEGAGQGTEIQGSEKKVEKGRTWEKEQESQASGEGWLGIKVYYLQTQSERPARDRFD